MLWFDNAYSDVVPAEDSTIRTAQSQSLRVHQTKTNFGGGEVTGKQETEQPEFGAYVGIDWADQTHVISLRAGNSQVERCELPHKPEHISKWVSGLQQRFPGQRIAVALEQSRGALIYALMSYDCLVLYPVNPKAVAKYREAFYVSGAKDDPTDADLLLELVTVHRDKLRAWRPADELTRTITLLVEYRRQLVDDQTALTNRLANRLKLYYPQALAWAGELATVQACDFLQRWPSLAAVQKTTAAKLREFYIRHGCRKAQVIAQRLQEIQQAQPLTRDLAIISATMPMVQATVSQLRPVLAAIQQMDKQIAALFAQHADHDLFDSFPGAGPVLAPRLLAALGADRGRFASARELQQFSGIAPVTERSGRSCFIHRRLACPKFVRQSFHEFAAQSIRWSGWARIYYDQQRARGNRHHAAVRSLAFKWIRIIYRCWQMGVAYHEQTYLQSLRRRNSPLIKSLNANATEEAA
nr:B75 [uncultured bacterium]